MYLFKPPVPVKTSDKKQHFIDVKCVFNDHCVVYISTTICNTKNVYKKNVSTKVKQRKMMRK